MGARRSVIILVNCSAPLLKLPIRRISSRVVRVKEQIEYFRKGASKECKSGQARCEIRKNPAFCKVANTHAKHRERNATTRTGFSYGFLSIFGEVR